MKNSEVFRARNSLILSLIAYAMLILFAIEEWITATTSGFIAALAALILVAQLIYLVLQRPIVVLTDDYIRIVNPFSEHSIGWHEIESIDARYTMSLETIDGDRIYAWAASAPGRYHSRKIHPAEVKGMGLPDVMRAGESPRTDSGVATYLARVRHSNFKSLSTFKRVDKRNTRGAICIAVNIAAIVLINLLK